MLKLLGRVARPACLVLLPLALVTAGHGKAEDATAERPSTCEGRTDTLGVSRIIEVDTHGGHLFGFQYGAPDYLQPGEVILTFDDGPSRAHTPAVLDALDAYCTRATFFMVGRMAVADPQMAREVARRGHTIGTHTWSHRNLRSLGPSRAKAEIELGVSAVSKVLGTPVAPFFRFPYLSDPKTMIGYLRERDFGVFSIDVDSADFRTRSPTEMRRRVLRLLEEKGKGILLFHDIQTSTARGIKDLLGEIKARGYKVVHLVPKEPAKTTAEFDEAAERQVTRTARTLAHEPLADRSIVWPVAHSAEAEGLVKPRQAARRAHRRHTRSIEQ